MRSVCQTLYAMKWKKVRSIEKRFPGLAKRCSPLRVASASYLGSRFTIHWQKMWWPSKRSSSGLIRSSSSFPLWWYKPPAILKGLDWSSFFSCGFAYGVGKHNDKTLEWQIWARVSSRASVSHAGTILRRAVGRATFQHEASSVDRLKICCSPFNHGVLFYNYWLRRLTSICYIQRADNINKAMFRGYLWKKLSKSNLCSYSDTSYSISLSESWHSCLGLCEVDIDIGKIVMDSK